MKIIVATCIFIIFAGIGFLFARQFINDDRCMTHLHTYSQWNGGDECTVPVHVSGLL